VKTGIQKLLLLTKFQFYGINLNRRGKMKKIVLLFLLIIATPNIFVGAYRRTRKITQAVRDTIIIVSVIITVKFLEKSKLAEAIRI
jgi:hypothetical protein